MRVLATFDAGQGQAHAAHFEEAAAQLAAAQTVVLSKLDCAGSPTTEAGAAAAQAINPYARIIAEPDRRRRALAAFTGPGPAASPTAPPTIVGLRSILHPRIAVFRVDVPPVLDWDAVARWIEDLAARCGNRLLRAKGLVEVTGVNGLVLVQGVGTIFSPPLRVAPGAGTPGAVIVIAHDLTEADLAEACTPHGVVVATA